MVDVNQCDPTAPLPIVDTSGRKKPRETVRFVALKTSVGVAARFPALIIGHQSFQFLIDASVFKNLDRAMITPEIDFESFISIFNEYIAHNSPSEVNIDSKSKDEITGHTRRDAYVALSPVRQDLLDVGPLSRQSPRTI